MIGYARVSTTDQDLDVQLAQLKALGVEADRCYTDHGISGGRRDRPGLDKALAAARAGDVFVVTKLDRLARSLKDALAILDHMESTGVVLNIGGQVHNFADPVGKLLVNVLAMVAEFELELAKQRTREGLAEAKRRGRLTGRQPSTTPRQRAAIRQAKMAGASVREIAALFKISKSTVGRVVRSSD